MSDEQDLHTETESEDGGVPVSGLESSGMDLDSGTSSSTPTSSTSDNGVWPFDLAPSAVSSSPPVDPQTTIAQGISSFSMPPGSQAPNMSTLVDFSIEWNHTASPIFYAPEDIDDGVSETDDFGPETTTATPWEDLDNPMTADEPLPPTTYEPVFFHQFGSGPLGDDLALPYPADPRLRTNFTCHEFFHHWKQMYLHKRPQIPCISELANRTKSQADQRPEKLAARDVVDGQTTIQGIRWSRFQTTQEQAREVRRMTYRNHINMPGKNPTLAQDQKVFGYQEFKISFQSEKSPAIPFCDERYFRFKEMNTKYKPHIRHYQLHHNLSASSPNSVFYNRFSGRLVYMDPQTNLMSHVARKWGIMCVNPAADTEISVLDVGKIYDKDAPKLEDITTLSASNDVLVAGDMQGVYGYRSLSTSYDSEITTGTIVPMNRHDDSSTNHVHTFLDRRSGLVQAVFNSNDSCIRILDCTTNKWVRKHKFNTPVNCSATSPDGRLRILVSDDETPVVADAETGEQIALLPGHTDHGFACAWAPDGITMATGHQDGIVQIWDARNMSASMLAIPSEMAGVRALEFSPLGAGKPVLVLAEPADFVSVVDATMFQSKQTIEFFGEIAGITMPPDGSTLFIGNSDPNYGGLLEFERTANSSAFSKRRPRRRRVRDIDESGDRRNDFVQMADVVDVDKGGQRATRFQKVPGKECYLDWVPEGELEMMGGGRCLPSRAHRWRRHLGLGQLLL